jgi:thymidine kinase
LAANKGKMIVVSALNGTSEKKPFGQIPNLIPHCENITNLTAICASCQKEASFSKKISKEQKKEKLNSDIDIGGSDKYEASCRRCFDK